MDNQWIDLRPEEKLEEMFKTWFSPPGVKFETPAAEKAYHDRITRIKDIIQLKLPDRVPVYTSGTFFPAYYAGITLETVMKEYGVYQH